jgi:transcriptional regulator with XRE-family HTH domain
MSNNSDADIGMRVRERRKALGLSMKELAAQLGAVHFTTVGKLETGKMKFTAEWIQSIAEALHVTPASLVNSRFAPESVKMTPLYSGLSMGPDGEAFKDAEAFAEIPVLTVASRCYSVLVPDDETNPHLAFGHWYITIDPDDRHMIHGGLYAMRFPEARSVSFASFRVDSASLVAWPSGTVESLGERAFQVIGKVIYQSRAISPAAGTHKAGYDAFLKDYSEFG